MKKKNLGLKIAALLLSFGGFAAINSVSNSTFAMEMESNYEAPISNIDEEKDKIKEEKDKINILSKESIQNEFKQLQADFNKVKKVAEKFVENCDGSNVLQSDLEFFQDYLSPLKTVNEDMVLESKIDPSMKTDAEKQINSDINSVTDDLVSYINIVNEHLKKCAKLLNKVETTTYASELVNTYKSEFQSQAKNLLSTMFNHEYDPFKASIFRGTSKTKTPIFYNMRKINIYAVLNLTKAISDLKETYVNGLQMNNESFLSQFSPIWKDKEQKSIKIAPEN